MPLYPSKPVCSSVGPCDDGLLSPFSGQKGRALQAWATDRRWTNLAFRQSLHSRLNSAVRRRGNPVPPEFKTSRTSSRQLLGSIIEVEQISKSRTTSSPESAQYHFSQSAHSISLLEANGPPGPAPPWPTGTTFLFQQNGQRPSTAPSSLFDNGRLRCTYSSSEQEAQGQGQKDQDPHSVGTHDLHRLTSPLPTPLPDAI